MENAFDRRLSEKMRAELAAHHEPFQPQDWSKMKNRLDAYKRTPQYWLTKASGAICLFVMLFSIVHQTSNNDYRLFQKALSSINAKAVSWWNNHEEISKHIENESTIIVTDNNVIQHNLLVDDLSDKIELSKNEAFMDIIPTKRVMIDVEIKPSQLILYSILDSGQKSKKEKRTLNKISSKKLFVADNTDLDSLFVKRKKWEYLKPSKLVASLNTSLVVGYIKNQNKELSLDNETYSMGILVGKSFNKNKLLIQTGAIYAKFVNREMYSQEKRVGKNTVTEYIPLEGSFYVLDIPLRVQYNFETYKPHYQLFVSTSLSNYMFLEEKVVQTTLPKNSNKRYNANAYYPSKKTQLGEKMEWASTITLSVGLERKLNANTSISFEPYIMIPLKGIGSEAIKLKATGLMMKLNFQGKNQGLK
jgi:hypothetical protein